MSETNPPPADDLAALRIHREDETPRRNRSSKLPWALLLLLLLGGAGYGLWRRYANAVPLVRTALVLRSHQGPSGSVVLTASAYLVSRYRSTIGAKVAGRLEKLHIEEGQRVKTGDLLAELDSKDYQARRNEARANLADAKRELERQKNLLASGAGTQQKVDEQQTRLEVFEAQLELAEVNLENTKVYAPFDGVILQKQAEIGEMVSPGVVSGAVSSGAIALLGSDEIEVEADVNESNLSKILVGQEAEIVLDAFPDKRLRGRIRLIEPKADRQKAVVQARISILDPDESLRPDMGAKATFLAPGKSAAAAKNEQTFVLVPSEAVISAEGGRAVFVLEGEVARLQPVETGATQGAQIAVRKGLAGGEIVILAPAVEIHDGIRVRIETKKD